MNRITLTPNLLLLDYLVFVLCVRQLPYLYVISVCSISIRCFWIYNSRGIALIFVKYDLKLVLELDQTNWKTLSSSDLYEIPILEKFTDLNLTQHALTQLDVMLCDNPELMPH